MTTKKRQHNYPQDFKDEAVKLMTDKGYTAKQAAEATGAPVEYIYKWRKLQAKKDEGLILTGSEREELLKLRKENKQLNMEKDILKKAATFFAKEMK